jgi:hypothetical protein
MRFLGRVYSISASAPLRLACLNLEGCLGWPNKDRIRDGTTVLASLQNSVWGILLT